MTEKKDSIPSNEQEMTQEVISITKEEILARATGGVEVIKPIPSKNLPRPHDRSNRYFEALPFGLRLYHKRPLLTTLKLSPTSAFKRYLPDLNEAPPAKHKKTQDG